MKRILFLLSFCLFFTANMQAETVIIDGLNYILDEEAKTASVTWTLDHLSGNIVIPDNVSYSGVIYSVTSIGDHAFDYFYRFFVNIPEGEEEIWFEDFRMAGTGITGIVIPESVTSIGRSAFASCSDLTSITIPSSVTSIGNSAFSDCTSLTGITVPEGVTVIEDDTFNNCNRLTDIVLPGSVTTIGRAFNTCSNLTSINIPKGIRQINAQAFDSCWRLQDVFCYAEAVPNGVNKITADCSPIFKSTLHVPASAIDKYKTTYPWNQFGQIIPMTR